MALPIQNARISQQVHDAYNVVGRYRAQIDEVVVPVALVDDLTTGAGGFPLTRRASARANVAAVGAQRGVARFETPPGILGVIRTIHCRTGASANISVFFGSSIAAPAGVAPKAFIDGRIRNRGETPAGVLTFGTQAAALAAVHFMWNAQNASELGVFHVQWPIGQVGAFDFVEFQNETVNSLFILSLVWDEYLIRP
jgi:hypothetical protein